MIDFFTTPFMDYGFMRRALVACLALSISGAPLGVILLLRRMTLVGDGMAHAILPGVALAFFIGGLSVWNMALGGFIAGLLVALLAGLLNRFTLLKEDASFTGLYLIALALGVLLISLKGTPVDLMHVLFGDILAINAPILTYIVSIVSMSLLALAIIYRGLIMECFDSTFLRSVCRTSSIYHLTFLVLLVMNLVAAFQAIGTLMALGLIILPAIAARFWARRIETMMAAAVLIAMLSSVIGLLLSYHYQLPSGPSIVLTIGAIYSVSILFGRAGGIAMRLLPHKHLTH